MRDVLHFLNCNICSAFYYCYEFDNKRKERRKEMKTSRCKACGAKIAFLKTGKGFMPTDWESLNSVDKRNYIEGLRVEFNEKRGHVSHFATCPEAAKFRKAKAKGKSKKEKVKEEEIRK